MIDSLYLWKCITLSYYKMVPVQYRKYKQKIKVNISVEMLSAFLEVLSMTSDTDH